MLLGIYSSIPQNIELEVLKKLLDSFDENQFLVKNWLRLLNLFSEVINLSLVRIWKKNYLNSGLKDKVALLNLLWHSSMEICEISD